jgi:hypothetical protein
MLLSIKFRSCIMFTRIPSLPSITNITNSFVNQGSFYCKLHNHSQTTIICNNYNNSSIWDYTNNENDLRTHNFYDEIIIVMEISHIGNMQFENI